MEQEITDESTIPKSSSHSLDSPIWSKIESEKRRQQGLRKRLKANSESSQPPILVSSVSAPVSSPTSLSFPQTENEKTKAHHESAGSLNYSPSRSHSRSYNHNKTNNSEPTAIQSADNHNKTNNSIQPADHGIEVSLKPRLEPLIKAEPGSLNTKIESRKVEPAQPSSISPAGTTKTRRTSALTALKNLIPLQSSRRVSTAAAISTSESVASDESFDNSNRYRGDDPLGDSNRSRFVDSLSSSNRYSSYKRQKAPRRRSHSESSPQRKNINIKSSKLQNGPFGKRNYHTNTITRSPSSSKHRRRRPSLSSSPSAKDETEMLKQQIFDLQRQHEQDIATLLKQQQETLEKKLKEQLSVHEQHQRNHSRHSGSDRRASDTLAMDLIKAKEEIVGSGESAARKRASETLVTNGLQTQNKTSSLGEGIPLVLVVEGMPVVPGSPELQSMQKAGMQSQSAGKGINPNDLNCTDKKKEDDIRSPSSQTLTEVENVENDQFQTCDGSAASQASSIRSMPNRRGRSPPDKRPGKGGESSSTAPNLSRISRDQGSEDGSLLSESDDIDNGEPSLPSGTKSELTRATQQSTCESSTNSNQRQLQSKISIFRDEGGGHALKPSQDRIVEQGTASAKASRCEHEQSDDQRLDEDDPELGGWSDGEGPEEIWTIPISNSGKSLTSDDNRRSMQSQESKRSLLTYNSVRNIDPSEVRETEPWIYALACLLCLCSTVGIGYSVLFIFGALGPQISDSDRIRNQLEYLSDDTSVFRNPSSPQSLALDWLLEKDESGIDIENDRIRREARYSLAVLYFGTSDSSGWNDSLSFLSKKHECDWNNYIEGKGTRTALGVGCAPNQTVTSLKIENNGLRGKVPVELSGLSSLQVLNLGSNSLTGTIPRFNFSNLEFIELESNLIGGVLPTSLTTLSTLRVLNMSANDLSSTIPPEITLLTDLEVFHLASNSLTGEWNANSGTWLEMRDLNLAGNSLLGSIRFIENFPSMERLDLSSNDFTGTVPFNVGGLVDLQSINIADNSIEGNVPTTLGNLTRLKSFRASNNFLSGSFPWSSFKNTNVLVEAIVSGNSLSGSIPENVSRFANLEVIQFGQNILTGGLPRNIGAADRLRVVDLSSNRLTGSLPGEWGSFDSLQILNLAANFLSGTLPGTLGNLSELIELRLEGNRLQGGVPESLGSLKRIEKFGLQNNDFSGDIQFLCVTVPQPVISADCAGSMPKVTCACCEFCFEG